MVCAIGEPSDGLPSAKEKVGLAGIADRPAASLLRKFQQGAALAQRDDVVEQLWLALEVELVGVGERGVAAYRRLRNSQHVRMGTRLARAGGGRGWRLGRAREAEAVPLADPRIASDAAKLRGDLTRRQPVGPQLLQHFNAFIGPGHGQILASRRGGEVRTESHCGPTISWPD